jgi:hypothetical protein
MAYHLPAEVVLESIDQEKRLEIENQYNHLIGIINRHRSAPTIPAPITGDPIPVENLCQEIIDWTENTYKEESQTQTPEKYVLQKLLVVMFRLNRMEPRYGSHLKWQRESTLWVAKLIATLNIERLVVCEAMMLSDILGTPVSAVKTDIQLERKVETIWDESLLENSTKKTAIILYVTG